MHLTATLEELTEAELLDHGDEVARTQRECEAQVLRIAVQVAILNNPDTLDPEVSKLPGRERVRRFGGVGTPDVAEFAPNCPPDPADTGNRESPNRTATLSTAMPIISAAVCAMIV